MKKLSLVLVIAILVLAACGGGNSEPTAVPAVVEPAVEVPATDIPAIVEPTTEVAAPAEEVPAAGSAQEAIAAVLDVAMGDIYYGETMTNMETPPVWEVSAGSDVELNLTNNGGLEHDWAIVKVGEEVPVPFMMADNADMLFWEAGVVPAGESATLTFTAPTEAGEYAVIYTVAGHYPSMQGRLVVQ